MVIKLQYSKMQKKSENISQQSYTKISTVLFLRNQDKTYKLRMKKQGRMIRRKKQLRQHIYQNNNIFQMPSSKFNRKIAQNIIWEKNYKLKMAINILRQQNSSVKARLWNIEKENRKMDKQIQAWNLQKVFNYSNSKPYIDMATVCKVFADQDYQIVSTKIDIAKYERILQQKQNQIQKLQKKIRQVEKYTGHTKHIISQQKSTFLASIQNEADQNRQEFAIYLQKLRNSLNNQVSQKSQRTQFIKKNIQIKRKINSQHKQQYEIACREFLGFKDVNQEEIDKLKQQTRKIRLEEQNSIKDFKKQLKSLKGKISQYQCEMQEDMGQFIKRKISLEKNLEQFVKQIQQQLCYSQNYKSQIQPIVKALVLDFQQP